VDEATGRVFVTHQVAGAGTSIFDANGAPAGALAAGTFGAVVDPATNRVYVTESGDRTLRAYDLGTLAQVASVPVGPFPYAVAVNSNTNRIYVASQSGDGIYVVNGQTESVVGNVPISGWPPYGVAVDPNTNRIYATGINGGSVSVIDGATNSVATTISVGNQPNAVAADPQTNRIYVTNQGSNTVSVIDGAANSVVDTIPVGAGPQAIAVNASLNRIYVANTDDNTLSVIEGANDQVVQTIPVGAVPIGVAVNNSTDRVYVTNLQGNTVTILDDTPPPPPSFVRRDGTKLLLGGQPFRPVGLNIYNANSNGTCWYQMDGSILGDSLTAIGSGSNTMRAWFFQNLATANGARDWTAFDRTLATARAHGYKVIATLGNQWADCDQGYGYKNTSWYQSGYMQPDPAGTVSYRDWVQEVVSRYKNDPTILAWQLLNEPEVLPYNGADCSAVPESTAESLLYSFANDVSGLIKSIDPNHLVSLGTIGSGQCGAQYTDYKQVMSIPTLDLCEFHDYTPSQPIPGDQYNGLQFRIDECNELNKPLLVGELGVKPSEVGGTLADRANTVASKLCAQLSAGVAGVLLWAWDKDGSLLDNFDIGPDDPVLGVLGAWSDPSHSCSAPTPPPLVVAAAGGGSASVSWSAPASDGGAPISSYTVTASPGGQTATTTDGSTSATVSGLANGTAYTFTVAATNAAGPSAASAPSGSITPKAGNTAATGIASTSSATTVSTPPDPATSGGLSSMLTVPAGTSGGGVTLTQTVTNETAPSGYLLGGVQLDASAPAATATNPLTLQLTETPPSDLASPPDPATLVAAQVFRAEGTATPALVPDCPVAGQALPDGSPCVNSRQYVTIGGVTDIQVTVLTASVSHWNVGRPKPGAVTVGDGGYTPASATVQPGAYVNWTWSGKKAHSVTDSVNLGVSSQPWFNSGLKTGSGSYRFTFPAAGTFAYKSTAKGDAFTGSVVVPVVITPASGPASKTYAVIWSARALAGYTFTVQYRFKATGSNKWTNWTTWQSGVSSTGARFAPSQGAGAYAFRASLRNTSTGKTSANSPDVTLTVS
jgi:YVTN family beta-propeller protein